MKFIYKVDVKFLREKKKRPRAVICNYGRILMEGRNQCCDLEFINLAKFSHQHTEMKEI